eukprot:359485-Chlamydomonas_euryale.AAC.4
MQTLAEFITRHGGKVSLWPSKNVPRVSVRPSKNVPRVSLRPSKNVPRVSLRPSKNVPRASASGWARKQPPAAAAVRARARMQTVGQPAGPSLHLQFLARPLDRHSASFNVLRQALVQRLSDHRDLVLLVGRLRKALEARRLDDRLRKTHHR